MLIYRRPVEEIFAVDPRKCSNYYLANEDTHHTSHKMLGSHPSSGDCPLGKRVRAVRTSVPVCREGKEQMRRRQYSSLKRPFDNEHMSHFNAPALALLRGRLPGAPFEPF
jgi:hypothetical protein